MSRAPSPAAALELRPIGAAELGALRDLLGDEALVVARARLARFERDETEALAFRADAAALPATVEQVQAILRLAHAARFPVVPRGAGTGLSGGALPVRGGLVLSLGLSWESSGAPGPSPADPPLRFWRYGLLYSCMKN